MRIALGLEYSGTGLYGWQAQHNLPTVQGLLQTALSTVANEPIYLHCAGRTDANVHASAQVVHFDTLAKRHIDAWIWGTNSYLSDAIRVKWSRMVDYRFHARFSAQARRYQYIIYNHPVKPALLQHRVTWHYYPLNIVPMQMAAEYLLGEQNFNSFRSSQCNSKTPMRCVHYCKVTRKNHFIVIEIEANAFLHHMVRNIVGVLLKIGTGQKPPDWMQTVLAAQNRQAAAETALPDGLYLTGVRYPETYQFPETGPPFGEFFGI